jgi:hypothetical protein
VSTQDESISREATNDEAVIVGHRIHDNANAIQVIVRDNAFMPNRKLSLILIRR